MCRVGVHLLLFCEKLGKGEGLGVGEGPGSCGGDGGVMFVQGPPDLSGGA